MSGPESGQEGQERADLGEGAVLVVDDDPDFRTLVCLHLGDLGIGVAAADSAQQALELLAARPVALVLTDLRMPGMDGAALRARLTRERPGLPVVLWSGSASDGEDVLAKGVTVLDQVVASLPHLRTSA